MIHKIVTAFPELSSKWLITGEGEMLIADRNNNAFLDGDLSLEELLERKIGALIAQKMEEALAPVLEQRDERQNILADNFHRLFMKVHDLEQWQRETQGSSQQKRSG